MVLSITTFGPERRENLGEYGLIPAPNGNEKLVGEDLVVFVSTGNHLEASEIPAKS